MEGPTPTAKPPSLELTCGKCLCYFIFLLLWLQGDSPGPVQKNLHNPIVQVGVPSLCPSLDCDPILIPLNLGPSPVPFSGPQERGTRTTA
jgi:hypothetical protein